MNNEKDELVRVENLQYLNAVKNNTVAALETVKSVEVGGKTYYVYYNRIILLKGDYLTLENARRAKRGIEPLAKVGALPWGKWEIEGVLISHKDQRYLRYYTYSGDLQDKYTYVRDSDYQPVVDNSELHDKVICEWQAGRSDKESVCHNVNIANITDLVILDDDGDPDVDIISLKYADEPDFLNEKFETTT